MWNLTYFHSIVVSLLHGVAWGARCPVARPQYLSLPPVVQSLLRESQVIRQTKEKQISELKKMSDQSAESLKNEWEKKVRKGWKGSGFHRPISPAARALNTERLQRAQPIPSVAKRIQKIHLLWVCSRYEMFIAVIEKLSSSLPLYRLLVEGIFSFRPYKIFSLFSISKHNIM